MKAGQSLDDFIFDCPEAKNLLGFLIGYGMERPRITASVKRLTIRPNHINFALNKIANNLFKIKHWEIRLGCYSEIENQRATWFIDPPYQFGGHCYVHSNKKINFDLLNKWVRTREGQIIVCENYKATWMDFKPMRLQKGIRGMQKEVIWSNETTDFDNIQTTLFP